MVALEGGDVVLQFEIELIDQIVECLPPEIGSNLVQHEINGHAGLEPELGHGGFDALASFLFGHGMIAPRTGPIIPR